MPLPNYLVRITPDGVEVLAPLENSTEQLLRSLFSEMEPIEDDTFIDLLNKLDEIDLPPK